MSSINERGLGLVPYAVGVHDEPEWTSLSMIVEKGAGGLIGLGIPLGGGALVDGDRRIEAIAKPLVELTWTGERVRIAEVAAHDARTPPTPRGPLRGG